MDDRPGVECSMDEFVLKLLFWGSPLSPEDVGGLLFAGARVTGCQMASFAERFGVPAAEYADAAGRAAAGHEARVVRETLDAIAYGTG